MRFLAKYFTEMAGAFENLDKVWKGKSSIDEKTRQFLCLALSIKNRSKPCLLKHFKGSLEAGATLKEIAEIMALTFRESAGGDDCWTHDALGDFREIIKKNIKCCPK